MARALPPPKDIPEHLKEAFTMNGAIPVSYWYLNNTSSKSKVFTKKMFDTFIKKAKEREMNYYGETDIFVYQALDELAEKIKGKRVGVIGSGIPWYESILISYGATPVVIEYNAITSRDPRATYLLVSQYWNNPETFDLLLSISSTEHDGLGRYGDPINPDGDFQSMENFKKMLNKGGKLLLVVPVGLDNLVWNAHRIYGEKRLKRLLQGWREIKYYGFNWKILDYPLGKYHQPAFLLTPL